MPSILWGIDGDWMVNIIPANQPFYPTDHCGILRIKTDDIIPEYMTLVLQAEGEFERFSRSNRASAQRISNLIIQIPSVTDQQKVVDEIGVIDKEIIVQQTLINEQYGKIESKFAEIFGVVEDKIKLALIASLYTNRANINMLSNNSYITTDNMLQNKRGIVPYTGTFEKITGAFEYHCNDILVSNIRPYLKKIWLSDRDGGCSTDILVFRVNNVSKFLPVYVYYALYQDTFFDFMMEGKKGLKMPRGDKNVILNYLIPNADIDLQNKFALYVKSCDKLRFEAQKKLEELNIARKELIDKYFG